jgi:hypothetical protein
MRRMGLVMSDGSSSNQAASALYANLEKIEINERVFMVFVFIRSTSES